MSVDPDKGHARLRMSRGPFNFRFGSTSRRMSSSLVAPSAVAILSTALLCGLSGTAASQPRQAPPFPASRSRRRSKGRGRPRGRSARQTRAQVSGEGRPPDDGSDGGRTPQGPVMAKLARLEREASSCNDGCGIQASRAARTLGLDASESVRLLLSFLRNLQKTHSRTGTTRNAWKPRCSWAGTETDPGGTAPAC